MSRRTHLRITRAYFINSSCNNRQLQFANIPVTPFLFAGDPAGDAKLTMDDVEVRGPADMVAVTGGFLAPVRVFLARGRVPLTVPLSLGLLAKRRML